MPILFYNAKLFLNNHVSTQADAIYVEDNKIKSVGEFEEIKDKISAKTIKIDVEQKLLLPGLIDTHTHFVQYALAKSEIDLSSARTLDEIGEILQEYKKNMPADQKWVSGKEWNGNELKNVERLDRKFLDKIFPDTPVSLASKDLHTFVCNSKALEKMDLEEKKLPEGSNIGRYPNGSPNGILEERAWLLIEEVKPKLSGKIKKQLVKETISEAHELGLTGIHIMEEKDSYEIFNDLYQETNLQLRVCWHFPLDILDEMIKKGVKSYTGDDWLKIGGVKIFMDGSLGSETAYMFHPYKKDKNNFGYLVRSAREYYNLILHAAQNGISPTTHSIGDRCNQIVTDAIIKLMHNPEINSQTIFPRIEHFQIARPKEQEKVAQNKIYCAMQPAHVNLDAGATEKKVGKFGRNSYPFRTMLDKGAKIGFGSDVPVETINPFHGIYAAVERKYQNDPRNESWIPSEKISAEEAIKAYTIEAALGSQDQQMRGSIKRGKLADLIVVEDYTKYDTTFWLDARSLLTMVNGKIVHNLL
ncbi:MAG: amidohydrolase [Candidatus Cloacimonetes bacterium]|nr:amidohydrolase [Candidatus Cloacimonadota bacterium]MBS3767406.1 amidohydrolase [Candidatus Cloacimonadota bacterium]